MSACDNCSKLHARIADLRECKQSHQAAAGRLARRNTDLRKEIESLKAQLNERAEVGI